MFAGLRRGATSNTEAPPRGPPPGARRVDRSKLADEIRTESRHAVDALHARGVQVVMITGDAEAVAASVAAELGIDRYFAGVRPEDKPTR